MRESTEFLSELKEWSIVGACVSSQQGYSDTQTLAFSCEKLRHWHFSEVCIFPLYFATAPNICTNKLSASGLWIPIDLLDWNRQSVVIDLTLGKLYMFSELTYIMTTNPYLCFSSSTTLSCPKVSCSFKRLHFVPYVWNCFPNHLCDEILPRNPPFPFSLWYNPLLLV